jgi:hypothetical protein
LQLLVSKDETETNRKEVCSWYYEKTNSDMLAVMEEFLGSVH